VKDWGRAWATVGDRNPDDLAEMVLNEVADDPYGTKSRMVAAFADALREAGLRRLRQIAERRLAELPPDRDDKNWERSAERRRVLVILQDVADTQGDPDAFIALMTAEGLTEERAVDIAERLLRAGRDEEALVWLDRRSHEYADAWRVEEVGITTLDALDRTDDAQAVR
jgi:hypothetical protein